MRPALQPQLWRIIMRELNVKEMEETSAGIGAPCIAALGAFFVVYGEDMLDSAIEGFNGQPQS